MDEDDVGHRIACKGPLEVIEQPDEPIGRQIWARKQPAYLDDCCSLLETVEDLDPNSYSQAIKAQNVQYWLEAVREEIESIEKNHVWQLIDFLKDRKIIGCK